MLEAEALLALGKLDDANRLLEVLPADMPERGEIESRRIMDRADAASKTGRFEQASALAAQARSLARDPELLTRIDILRGYVFIRLGQAAAARDTLQAAADAAARRDDAYQQASALANLALAKQVQSRFDEDLELSQRALDMATRADAPRIMGVANINMGVALYRLGEFERSLKCLSASAAIFAQIQDPANRMIAVGEIGNAHMLQGHAATAVSAYAQAFELAHNLRRDSYASLWAANLANAAIEAGNADEGERWNRTAAAIASRNHYADLELLAEMHAGALEDLRNRPAEALGHFSSVVARSGDNRDLQWEAHGALGRAYGKLGRAADADREFSAALAIIEQTRSTLNSNFKITLLSRLIRFYQDYVDLQVERGDDARALQIVESSRARVLAERLGRQQSINFSLARIRRLAAAGNTTLLSYWIAPRRSFAWLITPRRIQRLTLPPAAEIEKLVAAYGRKIEDLADDRLAGSKLWGALLGAAAPLIPRGSHVVVVPDGPLHRMNLETLPTPAGHPWIDDVEVAVAPSLSVLSLDPPIGKQSLLAIGAPAAASPEFPPLANAGAEIAGIQTHFPHAEAYTAGQAVPAVYRASEPARFSLIHFAAHAEANRENPLESAVILSRQRDQYKLYARDVIDVPIRAGLVTISACSSAGVRAYAGEGLIGFAWAFLQAGARSVIAGLWDVSDSSTAPLMKELYAGIAAGEDPSSALRQAKLRIRAGRFAKPYYWAPFQIYLRSLKANSRG